MNLASLYLRAFFGAEPFVSCELDSLAERMGATRLLKNEREDRYFMTDARNVTAANLGSKLVFGRPYYERLSEDQRLAVAAHELAHVLDGDGVRRLKAVLIGIVSSFLLAIVLYIVLSSVLLAECSFCGAFLGAMALRSSRDRERSRLQELRCDSIAVSFVGKEPLVASLRLAGSMIARNSERNPSRWSRISIDTTIEERASAILAMSAKT